MTKLIQSTKAFSSTWTRDQVELEIPPVDGISYKVDRFTALSNVLYCVLLLSTIGHNS